MYRYIVREECSQFDSPPLTYLDAAKTRVRSSTKCAPPPTSIVIEGSAHHYELRAPLAADPTAVVAARGEVIALVEQWLADADRVPTFRRL